MNNIIINIDDLEFNEPKYESSIDKYVSNLFYRYKNVYKKILIQTPYSNIYRIDSYDDNYEIFIRLEKGSTLYNIITQLDSYIIDSFIACQNKFNYKFKNNIRNYYKSIICEIDGNLVFKIIIDIENGKILQPIYYKNKTVTINDLYNNNIMAVIKLKYIVYDRESFYSKWETISINEQKYIDGDIEKYLLID